MAQDYTAAFQTAAASLRPDRSFVRVSGRSPAEMLAGILTNRTPSLPREREGKMSGEVLYAALLTNRGRMISDLRVLADSQDGFLLELPEAGYDGAMDHFGKFLPPRLAQVTSPDPELALLTIVGPDAPILIANLWSDLMMEGRAGAGGEISAAVIERVAEGEELVLPLPDGGRLRILGSGEFPSRAWDIVLPEPRASELLRAVEAAGAASLSGPTRDVLRVEKGRPSFGRDMDETTILLEAGIEGRTVDDGKGCYTGQEVIVRIRDRGHVNRQLRGLLLGDAPVPEAGTELFVPHRPRSGGRMTSAVWSPSFGQVAGLGYVRAGVQAGESVRVGSPDGPEAEVRELGEEGWCSLP